MRLKATIIKPQPFLKKDCAVESDIKPQPFLKKDCAVESYYYKATTFFGDESKNFPKLYVFERFGMSISERLERSIVLQKIREMH